MLGIQGQNSYYLKIFTTLIHIDKMEHLGDLFNKYGSDKDRNGYTPYYDSLFKNIRNKSLAFLEIGIGTMIPGVHSSMVGYSLPGYKPGGSLRAWRDYFPNGVILGMDVQPDTQFSEERITTLLANNTDKAAVDAALGTKTFDIILDDGSHYDEHQVAGLRNLWHRVNPGGYYIIEDIYPGSRVSGEFREGIQEFVGKECTLYFSEKKNILIISKIIR
jgi:hypothetical protein